MAMYYLLVWAAVFRHTLLDGKLPIAIFLGRKVA
jgi:hypothetical protein